MNDPSQGPRRGRTRRVKAAAAVAAAALVPLAFSTVPAEGTIVDVAAGHNITVFHNIDFVAVFGYTVGEELTVQVFRGTNLIGTATGNAREAVPGEVGLEVNHGPTGTPLPGDCWEGTTPNIRPGDRIVVTSASGVDEVVVDRIRFSGQPKEIAGGDIIVPFGAFRADGRPYGPAKIDSAEFRAASNNQVRFEANRVIVERRPGALPGQLRMRYKSPFRPSRNDDQNPLNQRQLRRALLGDGHAVGFGHVAVLPAEGMLVDGLTDTPGPAPGC